MALVVLLKGVNVGGFRTFRPSMVAQRLRRHGAINVGAAGTFVIPRPVRRGELRTAIRRHVPFEVVIMICEGREILDLAAHDPFAGQPSGPDIIRFVSVQAKRGPLRSAPPFDLPASGRWCVRVLAHRHRFVVGVHRREMRAITYLGHLERLASGALTTRGWSTIVAVARLLRTLGTGRS